jgi:hypothetical protein
VVTFSPTAFKTAYTAFATVSDADLNLDFMAAELFLNNSCCSIVKDAVKREKLLNLLVAHLATLLQGANGQPPSGLVGRIDKAQEGTVSVSASWAADMSMSEAYFSQTQYGAMFWQATAMYRTFHYIAPPANPCMGAGLGRSGGWPFGGSNNSGGCC